MSKLRRHNGSRHGGIERDRCGNRQRTGRVGSSGCGELRNRSVRAAAVTLDGSASSDTAAFLGRRTAGSVLLEFVFHRFFLFSRFEHDPHARCAGGSPGWRPDCFDPTNLTAPERRIFPFVTRNSLWE